MRWIVSLSLRDGARSIVTLFEPASPRMVADVDLHFDAGRVAGVPRAFIDCVEPAFPTIAPMRARVRAMPGAWFAVARCFVRVDGVAVRLVEARLLVTWDTRGGGGEGGGAPPRITREVRHFAGTFDELRAAGAPGDGPAYADGDAASDALSAVAPVGCVKFETTELKVGCE